MEIITDGYGSQRWYLNGKRHREDGPAIVYTDGHQEWCLNDKYHREDGPAIIRSNGYQSWYFENRKVTEEWISRYQKLKKKHTFLGIPVRDKWVVRKIVMSWYDNPKFKCVRNRLKRDYLELY